MSPTGTGSLSPRAGFGEAVLGGRVLVTNGYSGDETGGNIDEQVMLHRRSAAAPALEVRWESLGAMEAGIESRSGGTLTALATPAGAPPRAMLFGGYGYTMASTLFPTISHRIPQLYTTPRRPRGMIYWDPRLGIGC